MEAAALAAVVKIVAEYGVLGLGWVIAGILMWYIKGERTRYQQLVIHIIQHFTKVNIPEQNQELFGEGESTHKSTFQKLVGDAKE